MKLLMITRKVDRKDASPASFTYNWVKKFGEKLEKLYVITWQESDRGDLPENIEIISLPDNKFFKIFALQFKLLKILPKVDGVFCHQNPEYTILSAKLAIIFRKKIVSWYTHKAVNWRRRLMELFANTIMTASDKSFRNPLFPKKVLVTGHGIDTEKFGKIPRDENKNGFNIISVGRISPTKDLKLLVNALDILIKKSFKNIKLEIIGRPVLKSDYEYEQSLGELIEKRRLSKYISCHSGSYDTMPVEYSNADLMVNLSQTGSVDKAVLEAMACERMVLTSNEAFKGILRDDRLMFKKKNLQDLVEKIINLMNLSQEEKNQIGKKLRDETVKNHNLDNLVMKILACYEK